MSKMTLKNQKQLDERIMNHQRKVVYQKRVKKRILLYCTILCVLISGWGYITYLQNNEIKRFQVFKKEKEEELASLEQKADYLEDEISLLKTDEYVSNLARKEYLMSEEDEILFFFED